MLEYQKETERLIEDNSPENKWKKVAKQFNQRLTRLQEERMLHLLVTLTVGLVAFLSYLATIVFKIIPLLAFDLPVTLLFIFYLNYYRKLENTVQEWYLIMDTLREKTSTSE